MRAKVRRNVVVVTMAVLVCAAVALNWRFTQNQAAEGAAEETGTKILGEAKLVSGGEGSEEETAALDEDTVYTGSDYFASARLTRQQARDNAISLLQEAANEENASEEVANEASEGIYDEGGPDREPGHCQRVHGLRGLYGRRQHQRGGLL